MSITTSKEERLAAVAQLAETTAEQLQRDLEYWSVAKVDHTAAYRLLTEQRSRVGELYGEAEAWVELIAEELHRRRHGELPIG
jgi:hypothetical protein